MMPYRPTGWRSSNSLRREENLSIAWLISRTDQGRGLRNARVPSLSKITSEKPFGCNNCRQAEGGAGRCV